MGLLLVNPANFVASKCLVVSGVELSMVATKGISCFTRGFTVILNVRLGILLSWLEMSAVKESLDKLISVCMYMTSSLSMLICQNTSAGRSSTRSWLPFGGIVMLYWMLS